MSDNNEFGAIDLKGGRKVKRRELANTREAIWFPNTHKRDQPPPRRSNAAGGAALVLLVLLAFATAAGAVYLLGGAR